MTDSARSDRGGAPRLMLCSCARTMAPDAAALEATTGMACSKVHDELCRREAGAVAQALEAGGQVVVACGQEAGRFEALAEDLGAADRLGCIDIRDRAGWGDGDPTPKMAALLAGAQVAAPPVPTMDVESRGVALVYGPSEVVLPAAARLSEILGVTAMVTDPGELIPPAAEIDVVTGRIVRLTGALGHFALTAERFAELAPAGRGPRGFDAPRDGARSECDLVVDLSGETALVPAPHKRDGYLRADPHDPVAVERALFDAAQLVGTFEKTLHIRFTESLCAHSRAGQTGCTRCLDVCPTSAIAPNGDHVAIDPHVCAGCGACAAVCPSGAAMADELPVETLFARMRRMAETYRAAGGGAPRLLVHDDHGAEVIRLGARHGRGLPADVIPLEVPALSAFGHAEQLAALGLGYRGVDILAAPRTDRAVVEAEIRLARAVVEGAGAAPPIAMIDEPDPDAVMERLAEADPQAPDLEPILAAGGRRDTVRLAARALAGGVPEAPLPLPEGAPYGAVLVDTEACTLCLSCAGLCPTGALSDNPDRPELTFTEEACIQCGLCANVCPETAIRLEPRLDLSDAALRPRVQKEEEPFACIECGKLFGVKSTIDRIVARLESHAMFQGGEKTRLIQMCDDCRVRAQFHAEDAPFALGTPRRPRTSDDYREGGEG